MRSAKAKPVPRGHAAPTGSARMLLRRPRAEQIPPVAPPCFAPSPWPSVPIASCTAGWSKPRAGGQPPKPGRLPSLSQPTTPPFAPGSTASVMPAAPPHRLRRRTSHNLILHWPGSTGRLLSLRFTLMARISLFTWSVIRSRRS